jgi:ribosomal protein S18 acetylase RimI-like enzyme
LPTLRFARRWSFGQALADEVIARLRERGLRLAGVYPMAYDDRGRAVQADFLFGR